MGEINSVKYEEFIKIFGNAVEHFPVLAGGIWSSGPFRDTEHLHQCMTKAMDEMPFALKEGVLRVHPDLAGRLAEEGLLTAESMAEQQRAGLDTMSADERNTMKQLNQQYKDKFGFPFVICARENKKDAIIRGLKVRLENSIETEVLQGLEEVKKICYYRIEDAISTVQNSRL